jgi:hypothetical protein
LRYRPHDEYLKLVATERAKRAKEIGDTVRETLGDYVTERKTDEVHFAKVSPEKLTELLLKNPSLLKPLIAACNMGKRAIRKDLGIELDTFRPRLNEDKARQIAVYLLPSLPESIFIDGLIALDAYQWVDSAIRKVKGRWERQFGEHLRARGVDCKKRKFKVGNQEFELDLAYPSEGEVLLAVDMKMIGHPSDKHKRGDEIVNKAVKYKGVVPHGVFIALIYYPFDEDRDSVAERVTMGGGQVSQVIFAGDDEESIAAAVNRLHAHYELIKKIHPPRNPG